MKAYGNEYQNWGEDLNSTKCAPISSKKRKAARRVGRKARRTADKRAITKEVS